MAAQVSNCGGDENGRLWGGQAGDQTGGEYRIAPWADFGQTAVYRHPDPRVRSLMARKARAAALNDLVGYDQNQRMTFFQRLREARWDPARIGVACEADCSASTGAIIHAVGEELGDAGLLAYDYSLSTHYMDAALQAAGFQKYASEAYTRSCDRLLPGDILLEPAYHVNIVVTGGDRASEEGEWFDMQKTVTFSKATYVRTKPKTGSAYIVRSGGKAVKYDTGDTVTIDGVTIGGGYVWGTYLGSSGKRRYVAIGTTGRLAK